MIQTKTRVMKTKPKLKELLDSFHKGITLDKLKRTIKEDLRNIKKNNFNEHNQFVNGIENIWPGLEIKKEMIELGKSFLLFLEKPKNHIREDAHLIEYKDDLYIFYEKDDLRSIGLDSKEVKFFELDMDEQDIILDKIYEAEELEKLCLTDVMDFTQLQEILGNTIKLSSAMEQLKSSFSKTNSLREDLL